MERSAASTSLKRFFGHTIRRSFGDLQIRDDAAGDPLPVEPNR